MDKAFLGVGLYIQSSTSKVDASGNVYIEETIVIKTPASSLTSASYGKFSVGDVIKSISTSSKTQTITRLHQVGDFLMSVNAGDTLTIVIDRGGVEKQIQITIGVSHVVKI